jgi:psp operon transcriptional activator
VYRTDEPVIGEIVFDPFEEFHMSGNLSPDPEPSVDPPSPTTDALFDMPLQDAVREFKVRMLKGSLLSAGHNQKKAADILGLTYHQFRGLYRTLKDHIQ